MRADQADHSKSGKGVTSGEASASRLARLSAGLFAATLVILWLGFPAAQGVLAWDHDVRSGRASVLEYLEGEVVLGAELPPFAGGWGTSPDPVQYCLYELTACFAAILMATATGEGVRLAGLEVTAECWMNLRKRMGLANEDIIEKVKFTVHAEGASRDQLESLVASTKARCPGVDNVSSCSLEEVLGRRGHRVLP